MTSREILEKAIEKAEKFGFKNNLITCFDVSDIPPKLYVRFLMCENFAKAFWGKEKWSEKYKPKKICVWSSYYNDVIDVFDEEEFSKEYGYDALKKLQENDEWQDKNSWAVVYSYWESRCINKGWQYHLQQMVLEEPLQYIAKFIDNEE